MLKQPDEMDEKRQFNSEKEICISTSDEPNMVPEEISVCLPDNDESEDKKSTLRSKAESKIDSIGDRIGTRTLVLVTAVLIFLLLLMLILFASWPRLPHHLMAPKCNKPHCLRAAAMFVSTMNDTANPCTDPWEWACGQWLRQNNSIMRGNWGTKDEIRLKELIKIRDAISSMSETGGPDSPNWKVKTLYESCMNLDGIEGDHDYPLKKLIFEIGGWSVLREWTQRSWDPNRVLSRLHTRYGASPFFKLQLLPDPSRPGALIIGLVPAGLGMPEKTYYYLGPQNEIVTAYKQLMRDTASLLGANSRDAAIFADDVFGYEQRLASITPDSMDLDKVSPKVISMEELRSATLSVGCCTSIPLQEIIVGLIPRGRINDATRILLTSFFYIKHLATVMSTTERSVLNNYMMWTLVREYLPYLSSPYRHILQEYNMKLTGTSYEQPRWEFCSHLVYNTLPLAVTALVENITNTADYIFNREANRRSIENMFLNIKSSAIHKIKMAEWIDNTLKRHWILKVDMMNFQLGVPRFAQSPSFIKEYYSGLMVQKNNLFINFAYIFEFTKEKMQRTYIAGIKSDDRLIPANIASFSVTYDKSRNMVNIPYSSASPPYYHHDFPEPIQYGRLGVQIAYAMAGAILQQEVHLAAGGRVDLHMSPIDDSMSYLALEAVNSSLNCLERNLLYTFGLNKTVVNVTKYDTLVHITAVKISMDAMELGIHGNVRAASQQHEHFPGLEIYEDTSLFTLSYAQDQCAVFTKKHVLMENSRHMMLDSYTKFQITWSQNNKIHEFLGCRSYPYCEEIL